MPPKKAPAAASEQKEKTVTTKATKAKPAAKTKKVDEEKKPAESKQKRTAKKVVEEEVDVPEAAPTRPKRAKKVENAEEPQENGKPEKVAKKPAKATKPKATKKENTENEETAAEKPKRKSLNKETAAEKPAKKAVKRAPRKPKAKTDEEQRPEHVNGGEEPTEDKSDEPEAKKKRKPVAAKAATKAAPAKAADKKPANKTSTDWEAIDFKCEKKSGNGKNSSFHIVSWNVGGLRAAVKKGGLDILEHDKPDILCVQETKCTVDDLPEEITKIEDYKAYWCSSTKAGYAGVGILTKVMPIEVVYGIESPEHDDEGRCITAEYKLFYLVNVYVPNAGKKLITLPKRLEWNKAFKNFIKKLDAKKPVIICGDMNVAHTEIDLANPKTNTKNAGFTQEERDGMTDFLEAGYVDTFRKLHPDETGAYTFWTFMGNARSKNIGWRLDYFLVSDRFQGNVCDNMILKDVMGSDHCPISLHLDI